MKCKHLWRYHALFLPPQGYRPEPTLFCEVLECEKCLAWADTSGRPWQLEKKEASGA